MERSNVEILDDKEDFVFFKSTCRCVSSRHSVTVCVERIGNENAVSMFFECGWRDSCSDGFFSRIWNRIRTACRILFKGEFYIDEEFMFRSGEHLEDFQKALAEALEQVSGKG
jgi:hypothetical protein